MELLKDPDNAGNLSFSTGAAGPSQGLTLSPSLSTKSVSAGPSEEASPFPVTQHHGAEEEPGINYTFPGTENRSGSLSLFDPMPFVGDILCYEHRLCECCHPNSVY